MPAASMAHGTLLFHLNLNYSSIEVEERATVVRRCYRPMLGLLERLPWLVMAVEASGHTLELVNELDPEWLETLSEHARSGRVELVGAGDTQLIGPLVPREVNRWNQRLGQETYERLVGVRPTTALVNELAWSQGIVDAYLDAGYELALMEWHSPRRHQGPAWKNELRYGLVRTGAPSGRTIDLAWIDAIAFRKFQRVIEGDDDLEEYRAWLAGHASDRPRHLFLYANDAEIFDYRPRRYGAEAPLPRNQRSEWGRISELLQATFEDGLHFTTPSRLREMGQFGPTTTVNLTSVQDPIPVKKQEKYNVTRWALSGRDDIGLNARCFAEHDRLTADRGTAAEWRALCRLWASDLRTHITERRWREVTSALPAHGQIERARGQSLQRAEIERKGKTLAVRTDEVEIELLTRRGLAIRSLAFPRVAGVALVGTLPHGYFDDTNWAADFYSGNTSILSAGEPLATDLNPVDAYTERFDERIEVRSPVRIRSDGSQGFAKTITVFADRVQVDYAFSQLGLRPKCSLRTFVTLRPESFGPEYWITCCQGGDPETFHLAKDEECDHARDVTPLVWASAAFGATTGELTISDGKVAIDLSWPMTSAPALPLFTAKTIGKKRFLRFAFSLAEPDETFREGAPLHDFQLTIRARRVA